MKLRIIPYGLLVFMLLPLASGQIYAAQRGRSSKQATKQQAIQRKKQQREQRRVRAVQVQVARAKHNVGRAQEEIDHALALSLQAQEEQAAIRVLQESAREIGQAGVQLDRALEVTHQQQKIAPNKSASKMPVPERAMPQPVSRIKTSQPSVGAIKAVRVNVVQQQGTECGYWAALDAVIVFNALKIGLPEVQRDTGALLRDEKRMRTYLDEVQSVLAKISHRYDMCLFALDEGAIADIMHHYAHMNPHDYSMFSQPLPYKLVDLPSFSQGIIDIVKRLKKTPQATHIFFLRSGSQLTEAIGHWIAVVAQNDGAQLVCYIIDSLKSSGHDDTWQRLVQLIQEIQ